MRITLPPIYRSEAVVVQGSVQDFEKTLPGNSMRTYHNVKRLQIAMQHKCGTNEIKAMNRFTWLSHNLS